MDNSQRKAELVAYIRATRFRVQVIVIEDDDPLVIHLDVRYNGLSSRVALDAFMCTTQLIDDTMQVCYEYLKHQKQVLVVCDKEQQASILPAIRDKHFGEAIDVMTADDKELHCRFGRLYQTMYWVHSDTMLRFLLSNLSKVARLSGNIGLVGFVRCPPNLIYTMQSVHGKITLAHLDKSLNYLQQDISITLRGNDGSTD